ncbi:tripartite tricarboxylate transporter substrate binding protein [Variovorax ginsengisoli]|uniref:Tripartite-type tricarboxylate transporter receptor subunit TctC n=1 Tax=Variovorax ginsengisoli TaxID=363844 RepID=A0ABT9S946_9BURK|nr:tripartite tricarboxylate transporter substrate binding protein [Variovorax ginsengisoli]MDP9900879.1 tripartite-type tricarboxylate transporter receptor subunit TctC [Variovorax ginsengisoli]
MSPSIRRRDLVIGGAALALLPGLAGAQPGPTVSFIVPQPAGNPTDAQARKMQPAMQKELGATLIVENLPGAGGSLGVRRLLTAAPETTPLLIGSQTEPILTPLAMLGARYKPEDLRMIGLVGTTPYVLVGRPGLHAANLSELMALARQSAGKELTLGHIGYGSMIHLLGEQWARKSALAITPVPYKGLPPMLQDLMGGQIDLSFLPLGGNIPTLIETGKVKAYGLTAETVSPRLPGVPTVKQGDKRLADFVYSTWAAVFVARGLPDAPTRRLHAAVATVLRDPEVVSYSQSNGVDVAEAMSLEQLEQFYAGQARLYQGLARELALQPQ